MINHYLKPLLLFMLLLCTSAAFAFEQVTYYHNDALGSPIAASDSEGNILWRESYQPYGERQQREPRANANRRWFTSHVEDADTGLLYMQARYYDPRIGRFMSMDPVGFVESNPMSFNRYLYVNNNPYKYVDPDGEFLFTAIAVAAIAYSAYEGYQDGGASGALAEASGYNDAVAAYNSLQNGEYAGAAMSILGIACKGCKVVTKKTGKRKFMDAIDDADGPHTVWKTDNKGKITNHQTFEPNTNPNNPNKWVKGNRTDVSGKSEFNKETKQWVDTPHTHDSSASGGVRPASPNELPK